MPDSSDGASEVPASTPASNRLLKAILFLAFLAALGAGGWYGWQHFETRAQFSRSFSATTQTRTLARCDGAIQHALEQGSQAELEHEGARAAYEEGRYALATRRADEANRVYEYAITVEHRRKAELARDRVVTLLPTLKSEGASAAPSYALLLTRVTEADQEYQAGQFQLAQEHYASLQTIIEAV